ncbi:MAG TPA: HAD family phosphatase [Candidatus Dormibacteraeota bacterium]|nr:HAD family phosphatase [Candidatus Dormibacteraeota bacterium]
MSVAAVVFDLDGVIIDSEPVWEEVRRGFVAEKGGLWQPDSQQRLMGMSTAEWAAYLAEEVGVPMPAKDVATEVIARMAQRYDASLPLIPGAIETVRELGARWPLGLASSSPRALIDAVLDGAGLTGAFAVAISTEEVQRGKPSPDVYLAVARQMEREPRDCVAVEDSSNGIRAAVAAGMKAIAVERLEYPVDPEVKIGAALRLTSITELTVEIVVAL